MTRRTLVLTDEAARHPFLRSLPPHVRRGTEPVLVDGLRASIAGGPRWQGWMADLRHFLGAYCAGVLAVVTFFG